MIPSGGHEELSHLGFPELLAAVRGGGKQSRTACQELRARLEPPLLGAIHETLASRFGPAGEPTFDLAREAALRAWKQFFLALPRVPDDQARAASFLVEIACAATLSLAEAYAGFDSLWRRCREQFQSVLDRTSSAQRVLDPAEFELDVREGIWYARKPLPDCATLSGLVEAESALVHRRLTVELNERSEEILAQMNKLVRVLFRRFPHTHKDIVQETWLRLLQYAKLKPILRTGEWKGLVRTVLYRTGLDWLRREGLL